MIIHENKLTPEQFSIIQDSIGYGKPNLRQIEIALHHSIYVISVEVDNTIVGMGRIIGDYARIFYIQDLFIMPDYQRKGIGTIIVDKLLDYIRSLDIMDCNIMIGLMAAKGKEPFYEKLGFRLRPNEKEGNGMMINIMK